MTSTIQHSTVTIEVPVSVAYVAYPALPAIREAGGNFISPPEPASVEVVSVTIPDWEKVYDAAHEALLDQD